MAEIFHRDDRPQEATILLSLVGGTLDAGEMFYREVTENPAGFLKDVAITSGLGLAAGFCGPYVGGALLAARAVSAFTEGSALWNQLAALPPEQRLRELTTIVVYSSIQNFCIKKGVKYTPQIGGLAKRAVKGLFENKTFAISFIDGIKTNLELVNKFGQKVAQKTMFDLKNNPYQN